MRLTLNEQEVIDGICVFVSDDHPEHVDVKELNYNKDTGITASATIFNPFDGKDEFHALRTEGICEGILQFLNGYHNFNREVMTVKLKFDKKLGFSAEVTVNE